MDDFFVRALLGGVGVALIAGPLGSFVVWRRMAYFGETMAHSVLLGLALGLVLNLDLTVGVIAVCVLVALLLLASQRQKVLPTDSFLGILSHSMLSAGLVITALVESPRFDLFAYLFGDILAIGVDDIYWIYGGDALALLVLALIWRPLLALTVHEELARVEGVPVAAVRLLFLLTIALVIALALKIVGILLITSLLIVPAATARRLARTPEQMAALASLIGCFAVGGGLWGSLAWDTPAGPSIVLAAVAIFVLTFLLPRRVRARARLRAFD